MTRPASVRTTKIQAGAEPETPSAPGIVVQITSSMTLAILVAPMRMIAEATPTTIEGITRSSS